MHAGFSSSVECEDYVTGEQQRHWRSPIDGAHRHNKSADMFYMLDGRVQVLSREDVVTGDTGDVIVVPPRLPHAFAAQRSSSAEILIVIAPGIERFEYFRQLTRIARGEEPPESLRDVQDL